VLDEHSHLSARVRRIKLVKVDFTQRKREEGLREK
jgi:hypothetical protein